MHTGPPPYTREARAGQVDTSWARAPSAGVSTCLWAGAPQRCTPLSLAEQGLFSVHSLRSVVLMTSRMLSEGRAGGQRPASGRRRSKCKDCGAELSAAGVGQQHHVEDHRRCRSRSVCCRQRVLGRPPWCGAAVRCPRAPPPPPPHTQGRMHTTW